MITLKSPHEIELMRRAGKITAAARAYAGELVKPGVTTHEIDRAVEHFIRKQGAVPSFLHYNGYPASVCISVNDEIIRMADALCQGRIGADPVEQGGIPACHWCDFQAVCKHEGGDGAHLLPTLDKETFYAQLDERYGEEE